MAPYVHHVLLSFPVALWVSAAALLLVARVRGSERWNTAGGVTLLLGTAGGIVAGVAGLLSMDEAEAQGVGRGDIELHRNLALAALGAGLASSAAWLAAGRSGAARASSLAWIASGLAAGTAGIVGIAAHQGGTMLHPRLELARVLGLAEGDRGDADGAGVEELGQALSFADQVQRGHRLYGDQCADCHGARGRGTETVPPVIGAGALSAAFQSAGDLVRYVREEMPLDDPGSLSSAEALALGAFLMRENGLDPVLTEDSAEGVPLRAEVDPGAGAGDEPGAAEQP